MESGWPDPDNAPDASLVSATVNLVVCAVAFLANVLVIIAVVKSSDMHNLRHFLLVGQACTDLAIMVGQLPMSIAVLINGRWAGGLATCLLSGFWIHTASGASMFSLGLISFERKHMICDGKRLEPRRVYPLYAMCWVTPAMMAAIPLFGVPDLGGFKLQNAGLMCYGQQRLNAHMVGNVLIITTLFALVALSYWRMFRALRASSQRVAVSLNMSERYWDKVARDEARTGRLMFTCSATFAVCWSPALAGFVAGMFGVVPGATWDTLTIIGANLNSLCSPFLYGLFSPTVRHGVLALVTCGRLGASHTGSVVDGDADAGGQHNNQSMLSVDRGDSRNPAALNAGHMSSTRVPALTSRVSIGGLRALGPASTASKYARPNTTTVTVAGMTPLGGGGLDGLGGVGAGFGGPDGSDTDRSSMRGRIASLAGGQLAGQRSSTVVITTQRSFGSARTPCPASAAGSAHATPHPFAPRTMGGSESDKPFESELELGRGLTFGHDADPT